MHAIMRRKNDARRTRPEGRSVLVIEDEPPQREVLLQSLSAAGLTVTTVSNGLEAFEALRTQDYRAILCDLRMPGQSGFAFYDQLEEIFPHLAGRVVFMSALHIDPEIREYLDRTGQPFIQKPYNLKELVATVTRMIEKPYFA